MINIIIIMINMMLIPRKCMLEDKLMPALCKFLRLVHVDRERLKIMIKWMTMIMRMLMIMRIIMRIILIMRIEEYYTNTNLSLLTVIKMLTSLMLMKSVMKTSRTLSSLSSSVFTSSIDSPDIGSFCLVR